MTSLREIRVAAWPAFLVTGNPYTNLLYKEVVEMGIQVEEAEFFSLLLRPPDVFHIHFPESIMSRGIVLATIRTLVFAFQLSFLKMFGTKIVWTVHNLTPHETRYPRLARWFWAYFTAKLNGIVCLSDGGHRSIVKLLPELSSIPYVVTPHGHYRDYYSDINDEDLSQTEARAKLGLDPDARVLLYFGNLRAYKNVPKLIEVFRKTSDPSFKLLIAGKAPGGADADEFYKGLKTLCGVDDRIDLHVRFIADEDVEMFFKASDAVVLPYKAIQNSGVAVLALSFGRTVLVPGIGAMEELQDLCGDEWVVTYDGEISVDALESVLRPKAKSRSLEAALEPLNWVDIGRKTAEFYGQLSL